jgi:hypothetical protein
MPGTAQAGSTVHVGKEQLTSQANGQTPAKFLYSLGHKRTNLQRSIFVEGILKVLESLVHFSPVHNITLIHVEPRRITCVEIVPTTSASDSESDLSLLEPCPELAFVTGVVRRE